MEMALMTKNSSRKSAARKYQRLHPGTTFPEAMRAVSRRSDVDVERREDSGHGYTAAYAAAGLDSPPTTVLLPDGATAEAPSVGASAAARVALALDPSCMRAGDIVKWADRQMVAVGPGLVADPTHSDGVRQLSDVLRVGEGFEGIFRPAEGNNTSVVKS